MLEIIFLDIPLFLLYYGTSVFLINKYLQLSRSGIFWRVGNYKYPHTLKPGEKIGSEGVKQSPSSASEALAITGVLVEAEEPGDSISAIVPTDSILKRHYLSNLLTIATSIHPRPEEATLKRHHRQLALSLVQDMLINPERIELLEDMVRESKMISGRPFPTNSERAVGSRVEPIYSKTTVSIDSFSGDYPRNVPEEITLRRHFIQNFVAKMEEMHPRPTDNTLIRHYDQWLDSEIGNLICQSS